MLNKLRLALTLILISASIEMIAQDNHFQMWNADGTSETVNVPFEKNQLGDVITNIINVGDAAAVDLSSIANIMKTTTIGQWILRTLTYTFEASTNPNCIYFINEDTEVSEEMAQSIEGLNVVKGTNAEDIVLTDGFPFYSPRNFTATNIRYERLFEKGNKRRVGGGWQTVVLPFDVQKVSVEDKTIKWFANAYDDADFWVFKYMGDDGDTALFAYNSEGTMSAGTPYIVAVPDKSWAGNDCSLEGKSLTFYAENVEVNNTPPAAIESENQNFVGTYSGANELIDAYVLNEDGSYFVPNNSVSAFNAYIQKKNGNSAGVHINMAFDDGTETGIEGVSSETASKMYHSAYDLQGRSMGSPVNTLPKGIYIIDGKKVAIK